MTKVKNELDYYFKELRKIPVLEKEKTNKLALSAKTNMHDRDKLVKGNLRYVIAVAKGFYGQGLDMTDLIAEGNIGLITAVSKFKPEKDENFMKCAGWWIRHAIMYALSNNKVIRKPMNQIQGYKEVNGVYERESLTELDKPIDNDSESGATIADLIAAENDDSTDNLEERVYIINKATRALDQTSKEILFKKFGIGVSYPMTSYSISKEYNMHILKVDLIIRESIKKMKSELKKIKLYYNE